ncbi:MAG: hypothetical protein AAGK97_12210, partial [Bacteroidota bacterium]
MLSSFYHLNAQITLDESLSDWTNIPLLHEDPIDASFGLELKSFKVSNDESYIYFLLDVGLEINLQSNNNLRIYIDMDKNPSTGFSINGMGADLQYFPGQRFGILEINGNTFEIEHDVSGWVHSPTVTDSIIESLSKKISVQSKFKNTICNSR